MQRNDTREVTLARVVAEGLAVAGVRRLFGVPGGGNLDVIDAAANAGLDFILTGQENAAAIMAAVTGEIADAPGVVLTALGPGLASALNGIAYAALDRAPLLLICDGPDAVAEASIGQQAHVSHQVLDQWRLLAPLVKASSRLEGNDPAGELARLLRIAMAPPRGPVAIELSGRRAAVRAIDSPTIDRAPTPPPALDPDDLANARTLLGQARRPVLLVGLEARSAADEVRRWAEALGAPVLPSYKAKGVVADTHALVVGPFTGAAAEAACVGQADLIIFCGLDPVELQPGAWPYAAPVLELSAAPRVARYVEPAAEIVGPVAASVAALSCETTASAWAEDDIARHRRDFLGRLDGPAGGAIAPTRLVEAARAAAPAGTRATVDAGAHMFACMGLWTAEEPHGVLISNGLSTMGFAVPAAIASALEEPARPVAAFTGDGGLTMVLGELATAARLGLNLVVVVFNDARLSLIDVKQQRRGLAERGVRYPRIDFAAAARGLGWRAWRIERDDELVSRLAEAFGGAGPALLDVSVNPSGYAAQLRALRG